MQRSLLLFIVEDGMSQNVQVLLYNCAALVRALKCRIVSAEAIAEYVKVQLNQLVILLGSCGNMIKSSVWPP